MFQTLTSVFPISVTQMPHVRIIWVHMLACVTTDLLAMDLPVQV